RPHGRAPGDLVLARHAVRAEGARVEDRAAACQALLVADLARGEPLAERLDLVDSWNWRHGVLTVRLGREDCGGVAARRAAHTVHEAHVRVVDLQAERLAA